MLLDKQSPKSSFPQLHGGLNPRELEALGIDKDSVLDFSANINPLGPPSSAIEALRSYNPTEYPDPEASELTLALAQHLGAPTENILVGNGSTELIHLLSRVLLHQERNDSKAGPVAFILSPTFSEYERAARLVRATIELAEAREEQGFRWDIPAVCQLMAKGNARLVFLCNPNNPTGLYLGLKEAWALAESCGKGYLVLDEAFISFVDIAWDSLPLIGKGNIIILRSMTKDYALAGLRLGYCLGSPDIIRQIRAFQPPWSVNGAAQVAGLAALRDSEHLERTRRLIAQARGFLMKELGQMGLTVIPSAANFLLVKVGDAPDIRLRLLRRGINVRDCTSFGLPEHIRIAVRTIPECHRLVSALKQVLAEEAVH